MTGVRRVIPLTVGWERLPKSYSVHGDSSGTILVEPGGLRLFDPALPVHVQRRELDYGLAGHPFPEQHGMFRIDYDDPLINWQLLDGDE